MKQPLVSIVMPVKNSERFLGEALDSVRAQTYSHYEIIVVDGQSADASVAIALGYATVRVVAQRSQGFAGAWNEGIDASQAEMIAFLDSDDVWAPQKLALHVNHMVDHPEVQFTIARARFFLAEGATLPPEFDRPGLLETDHVGYFPGNLVARRALFTEVGKFDDQLRIASDVEWFARVKDRKIPMAILTETLLFKRLHQGNLSHSTLAKTTWPQEVVSVMKASLDRQRGRR